MLLVIGMTMGYFFYDSIILGVAFSLIGTIALPIYKNSIISKRKDTILEQFRDLLYSLSFSISCGRSMTQALSESLDFWNTTYDENDYIIKEINVMLDKINKANQVDVDVLRDFAQRSGVDDINDFVNTFDLLKQTGGNMPLAINRASSLIGDKIGMERDIKTSLSQKILEGKIVAVAPLAMVGMIRLLSPNFIEPLYKSASGPLISTVSLGLMITSVYMIWRITKIEI